MSKRTKPETDIKKETDAKLQSLMTKATTNITAPVGENPWADLSTVLDQFVGQSYSKLSKQGQYTVGIDAVVIPTGTVCTVHVDEAETGFKKWQGGRPVDAKMGLVANKYVPPNRCDLGDNDESKWECDGSKPRDPWQFTIGMPITRLDTGETSRFETSSKGGLTCLNGLLKAYGDQVAKGTPARPRVKLEVGDYKHPIYGKIFFPIMKPIGWVGADGQLREV
jgi:hypothetical protein